MQTQHSPKAIANILLHALGEIPEGGPESSLYLALGCDYQTAKAVTQALVAMKLITVRANWMQLTPYGLDKYNAAVERTKTNV